MADGTLAPRSRRALLAAAAGGAAALAASAALPLVAAAHDADDLQANVDNPTTDTTSVTTSPDDKTALAGAAKNFGFGVQGSSTLAAGVLGWSVTPPDPTWFVDGITAYTGVFGSAPAGDGVSTFGSGVWGDSDDSGVYGTGSIGVLGYGGVGVEGDAFGAGGIGVYAFGDPTQTALQVNGKVKFSRSGRSTIGSGKTSITVTLAGVSTGSRIFAVLHSNKSGRWVRAVVPTTNKFTIYLNTKVTSATYVAWFVIN
jgi:hypothetical protein